jgi:hypothetical protein
MFAGGRSRACDLTCFGECVVREPAQRGLRSCGPRSPLARRRLPPLLVLQRPHQRLGVFLQPARALRYGRGRRGHLRPVEPMPQALVNGVRETARPAGVTGASPQVLVTDVERNLSRHMVSIPHLYAPHANVHTDPPRARPLRPPVSDDVEFGRGEEEWGAQVRLSSRWS